LAFVVMVEGLLAEWSLLKRFIMDEGWVRHAVCAARCSLKTRRIAALRLVDYATNANPAYI
jgi:hypothetical protein